MIFGIGHDLVNTERIKNSIDRLGDRFKRKIFTQLEQDYCEQFKLNSHLHYAARFAAKEAFSKAIGTGISDGFKFTEVSIQNLPSGKPTLVLEGVLKEKYGHLKTNVTLSHTDTNAVAIIILEEL